MVESVIMGEMLAHLADNPLKKCDRKSLIYLGAIMALFDVIIDDFRFGREIVTRILENTFSQNKSKPFLTGSAIEEVYYLYLDKLMDVINKEHWSEISEYLNNIKLQLRSEEQYTGNISEESVLEITLGKGGVSALICSVFVLPKNDQFRIAVFQIGGFIQMMNDCQDLYKDTVSGIKTFVHFHKSFEDICTELDNHRIKTFTTIKSLDYSRGALYKTLFDLNAMFLVIVYKLKRYSESCNNQLDFSIISEMDKKMFKINPFSLRTVIDCSPEILKFRFEECDTASGFKFAVR